MIYNLACPPSPIHYQSDPVQTTKTSVHGTINMLGLAKRIKAKILQASTSEVYGDPAIHPQDETYWGNVNPVGLRSCYDDITGPINLGNTREFSILELATKIIELLQSKSKIIYQPLPDDDPCQRQPVIDLAQKQLNWELKIQLEAGLKKNYRLL